LEKIESGAQEEGEEDRNQGQNQEGHMRQARLSQMSGGEGRKKKGAVRKKKGTVR